MRTGRPTGNFFVVLTTRSLNRSCLVDSQDCHKEIGVKTHRNLYKKVCAVENLYKAFHKAKKGKTKKWYVKKFEANLHNEITKLAQEISEQTYETQPLKCFVIRDPKTRVIHASHFRDRVVHHALCNIIEPIFDRIFIYDSCANRKGKGSLLALQRFQQFQRKVTKNGHLWNLGGGAGETIILFLAMF